MADANVLDTGILEEIEDLRSDESIAVPHDQGFTETLSGRQSPVITTKFWDVKVLWKDKPTNWIPLAKIKESNTIEVDEAAIHFKHDREPAFNWWVKKFIKKRDRIIVRLHVAIFHKDLMKFGMDIPGTVKEYVRLDEYNGNSLWQDVITIKMEN